MRLGLFLPVIDGLHGRRWLPRWPGLRALGHLAEDVGFDTLFVPDHLLLRGSPYWGFPPDETRGTWEAWTILAALAEATSRIELGPYVSASSFRQPALLAKMAATLDEISQGRLILGLGSGSHRPEYEAFGYPWDHLASRFEEALRIVVPLLRDGQVDFQGRFYQARDCELVPRGPRPSGPPIWIAAFGPRLMRLAARWADAFNTSWHTDPRALAAPFAALEAACREVGRAPDSIARTIGTFVVLDEAEAEGRPAKDGLRGSPDQLAEHLLALHAAGASHITCLLVPPDARGLERFARVIERVRSAAPLGLTSG